MSDEQKDKRMEFINSKWYEEMNNKYNDLVKRIEDEIAEWRKIGDRKTECIEKTWEKKTYVDFSVFNSFAAKLEYLLIEHRKEQEIETEIDKIENATSDEINEMIRQVLKKHQRKNGYKSILMLWKRRQI